MGIKSEEVQIKNEIDELENEEININLEIYKLQKELNKRLPKKKRKKVKKNYEEIIRKWKLEKGPPKEYLKLNLDPYDMLYMDDAKKEQQNFNERKEEQNKKNEVKTKDNYLDRGLSKLKKRIKELEKLDKNDEKNETRKNKEIIKRDYIKEMKKAEKYKFEEDIKQDIIKNIDKLDDPDIKNNEKIVDDRLSDIYDDAYQKENSEYEKKYLDELELYENAIKIKDLKDKLEYVKIKKIKGKEGEYDDYEYEIISNQEIKKAIEERNNMIKNGNVILKDNSPYSEIEDEEPEKNEEKEQSEEKSESISEYY
jgi:hypothetical protein